MYRGGKCEHIVPPQVDFMNVHVYTCEPHVTIDLVRAMRRYSRPVWLTEFACILGPSTLPATTANNLRKQLKCVLLRANGGESTRSTSACGLMRRVSGICRTGPDDTAAVCPLTLCLRLP